MVNKPKIKKAVRMILEAIGDDPDREGLKKTPHRVAEMYEKILNGYEEDAEKELTVFKPESNDMVIIKDIPIYSFCEHHLILFFGTMDVAYIPDKKMAGLSKLVRMARVYAKRPQVQERLTRQIVDCIVKHLSPDCIVRLSCEHLCMSCRGVRTPGATTVTMAARGKFLKAPEGKSPKDEFLKNIK